MRRRPARSSAVARKLLATATCSANCPGGQASLALGWTYDRLGDRWSQAPTAGVASTASASFTGQDNRLDGASYDAAGDLLVSGKAGDPDYRTYTWDAENRLTGVGGDVTASYAYDAAGRRVSTTVAGGTTLRFFDGQGRTVRRIDPSGQWRSSEIYALGQALATYDQSGAEGMTWFLDLDPVGTVRTLTNGSGQFAQACTSLPFGDGQACSPAISDPSPLHFTGKPRDAETGLDFFGARFYNSSLGRWMTPDWSATPEAVPYAQLDNPQSLNLYAYVLNNPVTSVDPDGHWPPELDSGLISASDITASYGATRGPGGENFLLGGLQAVAGVVEVAGGGIVSGGTEGVGAVAGGAVIVHGEGQVFSGATKMLGAWTHKDFSKATKAVEVVTNPLAAATAVGTGGNMPAAGEVASATNAVGAISTLAQAGSAAKSVSGVGSAVGFAATVTDAVSSVVSGIRGLLSGTPPPPPQSPAPHPTSGCSETGDQRSGCR